jgi:hypothetical protein
VYFFYHRHLKAKHPDNYKQYLECKSTSLVSQPGISSFFQKQDASYCSNNPRQRMLSKSVVENLIVGCGLPVSIVENEHFRNFMSDVDSKYVVPCRKTVTTSHLTQLLKVKQESVKHAVCAAGDVALTVDIWSDRRQHSFIAITAHIFEKSVGSKSLLICFKSFKGTHTGQSIADVIERVIDDYSLRAKVHFMVTDNASNMKKAACFLFPVSDTPDENQLLIDDFTALDDPDLYEDIAIDDLGVTCLDGERLPCFAHSLQLTVRDGLQMVQSSRGALAKCSKLANLIHQSCKFKESFEKIFGKDRSLPVTNDTRWNSFYSHLTAIVKLDKDLLSQLCREENQTNLILTVRELQQLKELVEVLEPFADSTDIAQGDDYVTISNVVPIIVSLNQKLEAWSSSVQFQRPVVKELHRSLYERFRGIFDQLDMSVPSGVVLTTKSSSKDLQFTSDVWITSCVIDPRHGYKWIPNCKHTVAEREALKRKIFGT